MPVRALLDDLGQFGRDPTSPRQKIIRIATYDFRNLAQLLLTWPPVLSLDLRQERGAHFDLLRHVTEAQTFRLPFPANERTELLPPATHHFLATSHLFRDHFTPDSMPMCQGPTKRRPQGRQRGLTSK